MSMSMCGIRVSVGCEWSVYGVCEWCLEYEVCVVCVYVCVVYGCAWVYMECGHVRCMSVSGVCGVWV